MIQECTLRTQKGPIIIFSTKGKTFSLIFLQQFMFHALQTGQTGLRLVEVRATANAKDGMIPSL